jgi:hypothetical protein
VVVFFLSLTGAAHAAEGVAMERTRETWTGLIATPLSGGSILRAKRLGALWRVRWGVVPLLALWLVGLVAGGVHPLGVVLAVAGLAAGAWFCAALGTFFSLTSRDVAQASSWTLSLVLALCASAFVPLVAINMTSQPALLLLGVGSMPFVSWMPLASYLEVERLFSPSRFNEALPGGAGQFGEWAIAVAATYVLAVAGHAVAAFCLCRVARARFDRIVGRPIRTSANPDDLESPARNGTPRPSAAETVTIETTLGV